MRYVLMCAGFIKPEEEVEEKFRLIPGTRYLLLLFNFVKI